MHVLIVNNIYPPFTAGGAERIVAWLAEGLAGREYRVTVVSTCGPEMEPCPVEWRNGVEVIRFFPRNLYWNFARDGAGRWRKLLWHLRDAWNADAARRFRAVLDQTRPDIVHTHLLDGLSAAVWHAARRRGVRLVHTAHDYHLLCPRAFLLDRDWKPCTRPGFGCRAYRAWHLETARGIDLFVSPSRFLLEYHLRAGLRPRETAVIPNGIPLPPDAAPRAARDAHAGVRFLLISRLTVEKGVRVVLDAVRRLPRDADFEVTIAGSGPLEAEVRAAAQADPRIRFLCYVSGAAKRAAFARADHLLLPSLWPENAPVAIIEAAAYGLGILASRAGGIPELVEEGRTGLLFAPGDAAGLAARMQAIAAGQLVLPDLPARSAALAARHSLDAMLDAYSRCYRRLIGASPRAPGRSLARADA